MFYALFIRRIRVEPHCQCRGPAIVVFEDTIAPVAKTPAQSIVRDGEGATKFVTVTVSGGASRTECLEVGYTVAESPLVKTALFAGDANWGRFCMAIGRAQIESLDAAGVSLYLDEVEVAHRGIMSATYSGRSRRGFGQGRVRGAHRFGTRSIHRNHLDNRPKMSMSALTLITEAKII